MAHAETEDAQRTGGPRPPDPDDPVKPASPNDLTKSSWLFVVRKTATEFRKDQCVVLAAALTHYAVLDEKHIRLGRRLRRNRGRSNPGRGEAV